MLRRPIISEKSMGLAANSQFTFWVEKEANKLKLRKFISRKFGVDILSVRIINIAGKIKRQKRSRNTFSKPDMKKAIVVCKKGQKISLFEEWVKKGNSTDAATVTGVEGEKIEVKEKKSFLRGTKVKVEKNAEAREKINEREIEQESPERTGKTKGEKA